MLESVIRVSALLGKELNEIRRQPRLLASLILGPFLILMLFGAGYQGSQPELDTVVVYPEEPISQELIDHVRLVIGTNAPIIAETTNRDEAMRLLLEDQIDVVKSLPLNSAAQIENGEQATLEVFSNSINPQVEDWIEYLAFAETNELNRGLLLQVVEQTQGQARERQVEVAELRAELGSIDRNLSTARRAELSDQVEEARQSLALLAVVAPLLNSQAPQAPSQAELDEMVTALDDVEMMLDNDEIDTQQAELQQSIAQLGELEQTLERYANSPANVIVSPLRFEYENIRGSSYDLVQYFLPAVLALLIQHVGVALGALAIVRDRLIGALEVFQVAPVSMTEVIFGKTLAYVLLAVIVVAALLVLLPLLNLPILGHWSAIAVLVLLLALAALGIGFLISVLSTTESQAVQLTLLVLLLSIFFGNFFLPLENFWRPVRIIGYLLPLTHGVSGFQEALLRNQPPEQSTYWSLAAIAAVTFMVSLLLVRIQTRRG
ncbi:MAG: ABC transporter permease [Oscillochloris sp.]|nr:ABC transporter permease [Oscillochloris sp.]